MTTPSATRVESLEGMEIWKLSAGGVDQFGVRMGGRRARLDSAAQALLARVVRDAAPAPTGSVTKLCRPGRRRLRLVLASCAPAP